MSVIARNPLAAPATSPNDARYFDLQDLEAELKRTFQICHECRMCVNYCGSFPELFARVDRDIDAGKAEGAEALDDSDIKVVSDQCWQCKLCFIKCPYTKDDDATELLDFPRLMAREKAARAARDGVSVVDRVLGEPQLIGKVGSGPLSFVSNFVHESRLLRKVQEKLTGVSAEFPLPKFAREPFPAWFEAHEPSKNAGEKGEVVLFATCTGNYNTPEIPRATVRVLEHLGYRVSRVDETCCGMPNLDGGDITSFIAKVRANVALLLPHVERGAKILVPQPTCAYTLKREWAEYVEDDDVRRVAAACFDLMEFIEQRRKKEGLPEVEAGLGKVAYHAACHLRAQKIGFPAARVLEKGVPGTKVQIVQECSAVDGTWGMKAEYYETGRKYAQRLVHTVEDAAPDFVLTDCSLSAMRLHQETGRETIHPVQALAKAWGLEET
jgi:glycerol-3-phosphate dehydrogenase subunit C